MTNRHPAFDSSLNRDVCDALALAVLVAFVTLMLLFAP
jgi:hypothetical protein